jgi:hypothetical protein
LGSDVIPSEILCKTNPILRDEPDAVSPIAITVETINPIPQL